MKTTKKVLAAFLAVMMLALMIPLSASAMESGTYTIEVTARAGYQVTLYQIATMNVTTGAITANDTTDSTLQSYLDSGSTNADLLNYVTSLATYSSADGSLTTAGTGWVSEKVVGSTTSTTAVTETVTVEAGVYFLFYTAVDSSITVTTASGMIAAVPYTDSTTGNQVSSVTFNTSGTKYADGSFTAQKTFTDYPNASSITATSGSTKTIGYTLTSSIIGDSENQMESYVLYDEVDAGLTVNTSTIAVTLKDSTQTEADKVLETSDYTMDSSYGSNDSFSITLSNTLLASENFYKYDSVVVTYTAYLNANAVVYSSGSNDNTLYYEYSTSQASVTKAKANSLSVYTFELPVLKTDTSDNAITTDTATFTIYYDADCTSKVTTAVNTDGTAVTSATDGKATFSGLGAGTYYVKETEAPEGYNLNSTVFTVIIESDGTITVNGTTASQLTVQDTKLVMPQTGGVGTMMFTIGGAALIICAGVLFFILKKKSSKTAE